LVSNTASKRGKRSKYKSNPSKKKKASKSKESKGKNYEHYYRMYKAPIEQPADRPVLVALRREDQGVLFAHVVSKAFKAKKEGTQTIQHFREYKWSSGEACVEVIPLKSVLGNEQRFAYISRDAASHTLPLRLTVLPHISQGTIHREDWVKGTWDVSYIKISKHVQEQFRGLIQAEDVEVDLDA
jgi:hypothetical protein